MKNFLNVIILLVGIGLLSSCTTYKYVYNDPVYPQKIVQTQPVVVNETPIEVSVYYDYEDVDYYFYGSNIRRFYSGYPIHFMSYYDSPFYYGYMYSYPYVLWYNPYYYGNYGYYGYYGYNYWWGYNNWYYYDNHNHYGYNDWGNKPNHWNKTNYGPRDYANSSNGAVHNNKTSEVSSPVVKPTSVSQRDPSPISRNQAPPQAQSPKTYVSPAPTNNIDSRVYVSPSQKYDPQRSNNSPSSTQPQRTYVPPQPQRAPSTSPPQPQRVATPQSSPQQRSTSPPSSNSRPPTATRR